MREFPERTGHHCYSSSINKKKRIQKKIFVSIYDTMKNNKKVNHYNICDTCKVFGYKRPHQIHCRESLQEYLQRLEEEYSAAMGVEGSHRYSQVCRHLHELLHLGHDW